MPSKRGSRSGNPHEAGCIPDLDWKHQSRKAVTSKKKKKIIIIIIIKAKRYKVSKSSVNMEHPRYLKY